MRSSKVLLKEEQRREAKLLQVKQPIEFDPNSYDKYILAFSGGKDSISCLLHLLEIGIPVEKIELWHHDIDGRGETFMDWECTPAYCKTIADHFKVPIYFSWKEGGFKREMLRDNQLTAPIFFEDHNHEIQSVGGTRGKQSTRRKFPQVSPDLSVRWCSAYLKIDVCAIAIRNQSRFDNIRTLVISGERGEESSARAKYEVLEDDRAASGSRLVHRWRPIKNWLETDVWKILERWQIRMHPAYYMGWSRLSCKTCIFGNADQYASANAISPAQVNEQIFFEGEFGTTIKRNISIKDLLLLGTPYKNITPELAKLAISTIYDQSAVMLPGEKWLLPAGAYGDGCGPS